jgi:hypothetical protein
MSRLKALNGKSQGLVQLPDISAIDESPGRTMLAPRVTEWARNSGKSLAYAIAYPAKTKPTGPEKTKRPLGNPNAFDQARVALIRKRLIPIE